MSENQETAASAASASNGTDNSAIKLDGIFAFKVGMSTVFDDKGSAIPVTVLKQDKWVITQVKSNEKDGYTAVQVSCKPKSAKNTIEAEKNHFKAAGFNTTFEFTKELRQDKVDGVQLGGTVSIESLKKGDIVKISSRSKGRGFQGSVKRFGFAGGPAAHGSKFHRQPGSGGNRTWPGRVMPGKRYPGHMGDRNITVRNVVIVDVLPEENVVLVKGPVPGAANGLVRLVKE
ncbi:MAG: 50S ribosomal protein L3 [Bdellovibrionales bacterium]